MIRYVPSKTYFARFRVRGKLIWKSLKTDKITVAQLRLADLERSERGKAQAKTQVAKGNMTFGDAVKVYEERLAGDASLKPRTKDYHAQRIKALLKSWADLGAMPVGKLKPEDCEKWAAQFQPAMSPTNFNHTLGILRKIIAIGIESGARYDDPTKGIKHAKERLGKLVLPEPDQFDAFIAEIEGAGSRFSKPCADLVRFLAYGGFRLMEAKHILWRDCNFAKKEVTVWGDPETGTKGAGDSRKVPMIPEMIQLLERLRAARPDDPPNARVMEVAECEKAMTRAAKVVGMERITHHDLRHLFATRCIESGIDVPTVSRWLGHRDGGALAMRVYGHLRDDHSARMAEKVRFNLPAKNDAQLPEVQNG